MISVRNTKKLKVAFILGEFPIVSETFILSQITNLLDMGHEVEIFSLRKGEGNKIQKEVKDYNLIEKTHFINVPRNKIYKFAKAIYLFFANIHRHPIEMLKSFNFFRYGVFALSLNSFYISLYYRVFMNDFDIIHGHFGQRGVIGLYLKDMGAKGKLVTTFYAGEVNKKYRNGYKRLFDKGDLFIVNNYSKKDEVIELGCNPNKVVVVPTGIELEKFKYSKRKIHKNEKIRILSVSRLVEQKGLKYALLAIAKIIKKHKNIEYNIVGDGELREELEELVAELKIEKYVNFLGYCTQEEYIKLYKQSHIFLSPCVKISNRNMDQTIVNQEAQKMGLPIISTLHRALSEGVLNNKSGFLVPEKDHKAIANKLDYLIKNPQKWSQMGKIGSDFIEDKYDQKRIMVNLVNHYKS